ncbi:serine endopeptidase inhibitor I10-like protein [Archangium gephyra]|uniref:Serine endopeptidase inhibitor I10-like protein n=1 Tax=Archangium gephyra TaxID=48 RepID=A0AAC8Q5J6_9BACT|nr:microviridin/marinostatin family tricyclic proteinase inhibitor [Archangium gephyra]AKJ01364.1 Hypothetical protein AA314_02990 [Archangium gephyra]REG34183.1 serine endopeptidase inhibitor I10-like protein [Archangium gephyra]
MKKDTTKKPFFARLLEQQELDQVAGGADQTQKYPSDGDDTTVTLQDSSVDGTLKYPSDSDDRDL